MPFDKIVGIDWSGAMDECRYRQVQVAEYHPGKGTVHLVGPLRNPAAAWSRNDVLAYVQHEIRESKVLIGLDFAFAYPYCDRQAYFPVEPGPPQDFQQLWDTVEQHCNGTNDLYGGPFFRGQDSSFREYFLYQTFTGNNYRERFRVTDQQARTDWNLNPSSPFKCVGPGQVGTGSVAGMRFLHNVRQATNASIWPFDVNGPPDRSTVVEIYPRLFLRLAQNAGVEPTANNTNQLCGHFGANLQNPPMNPTDDQRDALVSAAGMGWLVRQEPNWQVPACAATYEGWIFGV